MLVKLTRMLIVQKYGGTSLQTPKHIRCAAHRIADLKKQGHELVVVVSAMGHMTDHLVRLAKKTVSIPPGRELDMLLTAGERVSMSLLAMCLEEMGVQAISFTGSQSGIITDNNHTHAKILEIKPSRIQEELAKRKVVIVAGFQGVSREKEITTLGRGGSDTTAVALAAALKADSCEVLTDVEGIFTADPRVVAKAKLIESCSYDLAFEMASLGAKMHPRSLELAKQHKVNLRICSSQTISDKGTHIFSNEREKTMETAKVTGIPTKDGFHFFKVTGKLREILAALSTVGVSLKFFQFSEKDVSFLVEEEQTEKVRKLFAKQNLKSEEKTDLTLVSIVGEGLNSSPEFISKFVDVMVETDVECVFLSSGSLSLTAAIPSTHKKLLAEALHSAFFV